MPPTRHHESIFQDHPCYEPYSDGVAIEKKDSWWDSDPKTLTTVFDRIGDELERKYPQRVSLSQKRLNNNPNGGFLIATDVHGNLEQVRALSPIFGYGPHTHNLRVYCGDLMHPETLWGNPYDPMHDIRTAEYILRGIAEGKFYGVMGNHDILGAGISAQSTMQFPERKNSSVVPEHMDIFLREWGGDIFMGSLQRALDAMPVVHIVDIIDGDEIKKVIVTHSLPVDGREGSVIPISRQDLRDFDPQKTRDGYADNVGLWLSARPSLNKDVYPDGKTKEQKAIEFQDYLDTVCRSFGCEPSETIWVYGHSVTPGKEIPGIEAFRKSKAEGHCMPLGTYTVNAQIDSVLFRTPEQMRELGISEPFEIFVTYGPYSLLRGKLSLERLLAFNKRLRDKGDVLLHSDIIAQHMKPDPEGEIMIRAGQNKGSSVVFPKDGNLLEQMRAHGYY